MGQKFRRNRSISLRFQDKHVFVFNAVIQDGRQKRREKDFCEKSPLYSDTLHIKKFIEIPLSHSISKTRVKWLAFCQPQSRILGQHWVLKSLSSVLSPAFANRFQRSCFQICVAIWVFVVMRCERFTNIKGL